MASYIFQIFSSSKNRAVQKCLHFVKQESNVRSYFVVTRREHSRKPKLSLVSEWQGRKRFSSLEDNNIIKASEVEINFPEVPLHEFVFENLGEWETKVALECCDSGKKFTYKDLYRASKAIANALQNKFKLKKGDRIAVVLPNCPEYPSIILACSISGVIPTTINPAYTKFEISLQLKDTNSSVIFTTDDFYEKCLEAKALTNDKIVIVVLKTRPYSTIPLGAVSFQELLDYSFGELKPVSFDPSDTLILPYSSGTSGLPKGVDLMHKNILANIIQISTNSNLKSNVDSETNQSIVLGVLPMFHIYGMVVVLLESLKHGDKVVTLPKFDPIMFKEALVKKKTQLLYLVPPIILFISNSATIEPKDLENVQYIISGAAPCGSKDIDKLWSKGKHIKVGQGYGLTETSPVITMTRRDGFHKIGSVGYPLTSTQVKVVDKETKKALPQGQVGEIYVKGPQVMKGYFKSPAETSKVLEDGWFKTGDVGYYDEEHDFFIVDREKELIKVKGLQVAPAEVEEILRSHPKISDAGVIGIKDFKEGEIPKAYVVLKEGITSNEEEIKKYVAQKLSAHKHLKGGVEFIKEIPKSAAGKILRKDLKKLHENVELGIR